MGRLKPIIKLSYIGLKVRDRNKSKTKLPSPCRQKRMVFAINLRQDATRQEYTKVKWPFLTYDEPDLCNDCILKDPVFIYCFCISLSSHFVLDQVDSDTNLINNVFLTKDVL